MRHTIMSALAGIGLAACAADYSLLNGDFEAVDANGHAVDWTYDSTFYRIDPAGGRNGTKALAFDSGKRDAGSPLLQRVKAAPGVRYRFGAWIRTENLKGKGFCARVCLLWEDQYGRFIEGYYYTPHISGTTKGWRLCDGVSVHTPANAAWATLRPEVVGPATGKAWFDDAFCEPYGTEPVAGLYTSAYRDEQAQGEVTFAAALNADSPTRRLSGTQAQFAYTAADGTRRTVPAAGRDAEWARLTVPVTGLAMGAQEVAFTLLAADGKKLGHATRTFTRTAQTRPRRVTFDRLGRTIVEGRPFFPLGMYWSVAKPYHGYRLPRIDTNSILTFARGPFNCVMPYESPSPEQMDLCHAHGIKVIYALLGDFAAGGWDPTGKDSARRHSPAAKRHIAAYKDHPALLAWYLNDERGIGELENLTGRFRTVKELDADHPSWICLYQYDQVRDYMDTFDCLGTDPYPIGHQEIDLCIKWAATARRRTMGLRPLWQVPQAFDWAAFHADHKTDRMPTADEMRNMTWQAIAGGANGLIYYSYTYLMKSPTTPFEKAFADVCAAAQEVKDLFPVLLAGDTPPAFTVGGAEGVAARTWREGGRLYVLAVNTTRKPCTAKVTLACGFTFVRPLLGGAPSEVQGRTLTFALGPIGQSLVELSAAPED